jgi:signal transduction histidine kinase
MDFALIDRFFLFLANITAVLVGFWVLSADPKGKINRLFILFVTFILLYIDLGFLANIPAFKDIALTLLKLRFGAVSIFFIIGYKFFLLFPKVSEKAPVPEKVWNLIWFGLLLVSALTPLMIQNIKPEEWGMDVMFGSAMLIYYAITSFTIVVLLYILFKKYFISSKEDKVKIQYYVFGVLFAATFNLIFNIILPIIYGSMKYHQIGDYSWIPFIILVAVSIVKSNLFGIRMVLVYALVGAISILLLLDILVFQNDSFVRVLKVFTLLVFLYFGRSLIKSVTKEIELREQLQDLNLHLQEKVDEQTVEIRKSYEVEKKARVELESLDKAKSEFILTAQHHLRTPLTIIKGYAAALFEKPSEDKDFISKAKDGLGKINVASDRLMSLVNEFLDISQMEVGKSILKIELSNIKPLIEDIIEELKPDMEKNHISVSYPQDEESYPSILIDSKKFKEALTIFIDNATKYNKENGSITVTTRVFFHPIEKDKKLYQITIENTGIGIKPDELPKLFTHYFERSDEARKLYATGRGLGLNIAKSIINAHNGTVRVESDGEGKGARFIVELPMQ